MIVTVTLNPCIDRTVFVDEFCYGGLNRVKESLCHLGGKGLNVSRVLNEMGFETLCTGFMFDDSSSFDMPLPTDFINVDGKLRTNIKIMCGGVMTELNEGGSKVDNGLVDTLIQKLKGYDADMVVLSGSAPMGIETDVYARIMSSVSAPFVLDADGELFSKAVGLKPIAIKPNKLELERYLNRTLETYDDICEAALKLVESGISYVCVSLGQEGALLATKNGICAHKALEVDVKSLQGAGDSMVAGLCMGIMQGLDDFSILKNALALASGTISRKGTLLCTRELFEHFKNFQNF